MTTRVAVATPRYGDPWDELSVLAGRLAGALACGADVDLLVPSSTTFAMSAEWDGACRLLRFPASAVKYKPRLAWKAVLGVDEDDPGACTCPSPTTRRPLPRPVYEEIVLAEGGDAPSLYDHVRTTPYDVVIFLGMHNPVTTFGVRAISDDRRVFVMPGRCNPGLASAVDEVILDRAERILAVTDGEQRRLLQRTGPGAIGRVETLGFLIGINTVVRPEGPELGKESFFVVARDWRTLKSRCRYVPWVTRFARRLPAGVQLRVVGPGAAGVPGGVPHTGSRVDAWWWMTRAVAVIDPTPHRIVGQEILEAMLFGVPGVVAATGEAAREHVEVGNAGMWFRVDDELIASVERLCDRDLAKTLGEQGRAYASSRFADTDTYVKRAMELILG